MSENYFQLEKTKHALVFGGNRGIGYALATKLLQINTKINLYLPYREKSNSANLERLQKIFPHRVYLFPIKQIEENQLKIVTIFLEQKEIKIDLLINTIGYLHTESIQPEKSLRTFSLDDFTQMVKVNAGMTPLIAKCFAGFINRQNISAFLVVSAKVGSISDNRMGGWYSYRASKAALNMLIKSISIEWRRSLPKCLVLSVHPGTTKTELSKPFIKNTPYQLHAPEDTAKNILKVLNHKSLEHSGNFFSWNGEELPW